MSDITLTLSHNLNKYVAKNLICGHSNQLMWSIEIYVPSHTTEMGAKY